MRLIVLIRLGKEGKGDMGLRTEQRNQMARRKLAGARLLLQTSRPITKREAAPVLGRTEGGEETKAARLSLSRPPIADPSHPSGVLRRSTRPKKDMGRSSSVMAHDVADNSGERGCTGRFLVGSSSGVRRDGAWVRYERQKRSDGCPVGSQQSRCSPIVLAIPVNNRKKKGRTKKKRATALLGTSWQPPKEEKKINRIFCGVVPS
ncbi:unnamed protein product [Lactuca saligna]|uniref:Uncharacterized protein n=1 Tax=Lactuca saligna TaxID=75948 RepID=A0AA35UKU2_LACSI|nr:unnamed protein product [Lactuca saligna]